MENPQTTCLGSLCPRSVTLTVKIVSCSEEICVSVCVHCLWPCHWTPVHSLFAPSLQAFIHTNEIPLNLLFSKMNSPSYAPVPFTISVALCWTPSTSLFSLLYSEAQNQTQGEKKRKKNKRKRKKKKKFKYSFLTIISSSGIRLIFYPSNCFESSFLHIQPSTILSAANPTQKEHIPPLPRTGDAHGTLSGKVQQPLLRN